MQREGAPQARDALQGHLPPVGLGDLLHHGQPQPRAGALPVGRIHLIEPLPDLLLLVRADPDAVVLDGQKSLFENLNLYVLCARNAGRDFLWLGAFLHFVEGNPPLS